MVIASDAIIVEREHCCVHIRQTGTISRASLDTYLEAMEDPDANVRWQAVHALERYPDPRSVEPLKCALNDESSLVRCSVARILGKIADGSTRPLLASATEDEDSFVREAAETALRQLEER